MGQRKTDWRKTLKNVRSGIIGVALILVAFFVIGMARFFLAVRSSTKIDTKVVRKEFANSALANSTRFKVEEIEEKAEKDRIFLRIEGVEPEVSYVCKVFSLGRSCWLERNGSRYEEFLGMYFWNLHNDEIRELLEKYGPKLARRTNVEIEVYNNDTEAATELVRELLEIPDMRKLYYAYQEEVRRTGEDNARKVFGDFWLSFYEGSDNKSTKSMTYSVFGWAAKQGL